jgi:hypothetical protein
MTERRKRLEKQFNNFVLAGIPGLQREGYNPARFLEMIRETGSPYATTIVLLNDPRHTHYGFERLWQMKRLDASVEYAALLPWFQELFTEDQLYEARTRLITHDFPLDRKLAAASLEPPDWLAELDIDEP